MQSSFSVALRRAALRLGPTPAVQFASLPSAYVDLGPGGPQGRRRPLGAGRFNGEISQPACCLDFWSFRCECPASSTTASSPKEFKQMTPNQSPALLIISLVQPSDESPRSAGRSSSCSPPVWVGRRPAGVRSRGLHRSVPRGGRRDPDRDGPCAVLGAAPRVRLPH